MTREEEALYRRLEEGSAKYGIRFIRPVAPTGQQQPASEQPPKPRPSSKHGKPAGSVDDRRDR